MSGLIIAERPSETDPQDHLFDDPDVIIRDGAPITVVRLHGEEPLAIDVLDQIWPDYDLAPYINFLDLNPEAGRLEKRFIDEDANRIVKEPYPDNYEGRRIRRAVNTMRMLQRVAGSQLFEIHNTSTDTAFAVIAEEELYNHNIQRMLGCIGLDKIVVFPRVKLQAGGMLLGRDDLFPKAKAVVEWPQSDNSNGVQAMHATLRRAAGLEPIIPAKREVFRVTDEIPKGTAWVDAENFVPYEVDGGTVIPLFYALGVKGSYSTDPSKDYWGFIGEKVTEITC